MSGMTPLVDKRYVNEYMDDEQLKKAILDTPATDPVLQSAVEDLTTEDLLSLAIEKEGTSAVAAMLRGVLKYMETPNE